MLRRLGGRCIANRCATDTSIPWLLQYRHASCGYLLGKDKLIRSACSGLAFTMDVVRHTITMAVGQPVCLTISIVKSIGQTVVVVALVAQSLQRCRVFRRPPRSEGSPKTQFCLEGWGGGVARAGNIAPPSHLFGYCLAGIWICIYVVTRLVLILRVADSSHHRR